MTPHTTNQREIIVFASGPICCAVCAPRVADRSIVESEVSRREPRGCVLKWNAFTGPVSGEPNPRPCPHNLERQHWLLVRDIKR